GTARRTAPAEPAAAARASTRRQAWARRGRCRGPGPALSARYPPTAGLRFVAPARTAAPEPRRRRPRRVPRGQCPAPPRFRATPEPQHAVLAEGRAHRLGGGLVHRAVPAAAAV